MHERQFTTCHLPAQCCLAASLATTATCCYLYISAAAFKRDAPSKNQETVPRFACPSAIMTRTEVRAWSGLGIARQACCRRCYWCTDRTFSYNCSSSRGRRAGRCSTLSSQRMAFRKLRRERRGTALLQTTSVRIVVRVQSARHTNTMC